MSDLARERDRGGNGTPTSRSEKAIRKRVRVPLPPDRAFDLFTQRVADWWPTALFSVAMYKGGTVQDVVIEPREGGAMYEVAEDGARSEWGTVTRWDPPSLLELEWFPGVDRSEATRIAVHFTPDGDGTLVELVHDGLDARPDGAALIERYTDGWDIVLAPYAALASESGRRT